MVSLFFFNLEPKCPPSTHLLILINFSNSTFSGVGNTNKHEIGKYHVFVHMWLGCGHTPQFSQVITYKNK